MPTFILLPLTLGLLGSCRLATSLERVVMLMKSGNGSNFVNLWALSSYNDGHDNKSVTDIAELLPGGDFKAMISDDWGQATEIIIYCFNEDVSILGKVTFNVLGADLSNLNSWMTADRVVGTYPTSYGLITPLITDGNNEITLEVTTSGEAWFAIHHPQTSSIDPLILLAVNSSASFTTTSQVNYTYTGCWPNWELDLAISFEDAESLTVETCITACKTTAHDLAAIQVGYKCFCATFVTQITGSLDYMCLLPCPGNSDQICGGVSDGYYSVYPYTATTSDFDTISSNTVSELLLQVTKTTAVASLTINIGDTLNWADDYIYIDNILVSGTVTGEPTVAANFDLLYFYDLTEPVYYQSEFIANGTKIKINTLLVRQVQLDFQTSTESITVELYGPSSTTFVSVTYLAVSGIFGNNTNTSTTTTVTSAATSAATTETPSDNVPILINGTLYCPCDPTALYTSDTSSGNDTYDFDAILASQAIDTESLSSNIRKHNSAPDDRASSKVLGSLGIIVLLTVICVIVAMDFSVMLLNFNQIMRNYKFTKRQISKRSLKVGDEQTQEQCVDDFNSSKNPLPEVLM